MDAVNPKYVLRTWMAHEAITAAQAGDFSVIDRLLQLLRRPYRRAARPRRLGHRRTRLGWVDRAQLLVMTPRRARWEALWRRLGATPPDDAFTALERQYSAPGRHYHTLAHLDAVLATFDELRHLAPNPDVAELALWLHDVVWEPMARRLRATER